MENIILKDAANGAAQVNNQVNNLNKKDMGKIIDFSSVLGESAVAHTATVDEKVVNDLFHAFMEIPQEVSVRFKNEDGFLKMLVKMNHRDKFFRSYETFADAKLVECMLGAMRGLIGLLEGYSTESHTLEASETDPRIEMFRQFINSPLSCRFEADFIAKNGDRYICAYFNMGFRKKIKFCLKRTEEVELIIKEAIKAA